MNIAVATCLWDANRHSERFSSRYDESWVEKLISGFARNLSAPFEFVLFTDRKREIVPPYPPRELVKVSQILLSAKEPDYGSFTEPYRLNRPMILVGLDTVIVGDVTPLAEYCLRAPRVTLPRDPYKPERSINGVALVPAGQRAIWDNWNGENDMEWLRRHETDFIDDIFPGSCLSLKAHDVRGKGLQGAKIVYFHGDPKPDAIAGLSWMREHWRA